MNVREGTMKETEHPILKEIISTVDQSGTCEMSFSRLSKEVFFKKTDKDWETRAQILLWAVSRNVLYQYIGDGDETKVLFYRRKNGL